MSLRTSCSSIARSSDEPLHGTAPCAQSWILIEQPGPWAPDALSSAGLDPQHLAELTGRLAPLGTRILLIRRRSGRYTPSGGICCYLASTGGNRVWMSRLILESPEQLLDHELEALIQPDFPGIGSQVSELFLVCTHGRRDPCCAEHGRALIKGLAQEQDEVWESSHQGGHRFAANLACFPHGLFYGRVSGNRGQSIIESYRRGRIHLPLYRGRTAHQPLVQSAEHFIRLKTGIDTIEGLPVERIRQDGGRASVTMRHGSAGHTVDLELTQGEPRPESCDQPRLTSRQVWMPSPVRSEH